MFGSGFGSRTTPAFGQSSPFGKPATTFSTPTFGTSSNLFGQTTQASTGLFGSSTSTPAFGQPTTTPSFGSSFGGGTGGSLFSSQGTTGATAGLFGTQNVAPSTSSNLFGTSGTSAFGQPSGTSPFGFGSTGGSTLFGQTSQSGTLFGQTSGGSLFSSSGGTFGTAPNGTTIKFVPVTGTDTMVKNGTTQTISTKHYCITCMKEYEGKSLEELRYEDYLSGRKGPQAGTGLFGSTVTSTPTLFGSTAPTTTTSSLFGSTGFGQSSSIFGQSQPGTSLFGKTATPFGTTTTTQSTGFGFSQNTGGGLFGSTTSPAKPAFGVSQPSTGLFGSTGTTGFGAQQSSFGGFGTQTTQSGGLFQQNKFGSGFGTTTTSSFGFGTNTATNTTPLFGQKPTGTSFGITPTTSAPAFGTGTFGTTSQPSLFGSTFNKPQTTGFGFGQTTATSSALGGSSLFGNTANKPGGGLFGSGGTGLFGSTGFGSGTSTFGSATNPAFGTFGGTLGSSFGSSATTAQQQSAQSAVMEQLQTLLAMPFGDAPLFKNIAPTQEKKEDTKEATKSAIVITSGVPSIGLTTSYRVSPGTNTSIVKRRPVGSTNLSKKSLFDGIDEVSEKSLFVPRDSPRHLKIKPRHSDVVDASISNVNVSLSERSTQDTQVLNSITSSDGKSKIEALIPVSPRGNSTPVKPTKSIIDLSKTAPGGSSTRIENNVDQPHVEEFERPSPGISMIENNQDNDNADAVSTDDESTVSSKRSTSDIEPHPTGIVLKHRDYYTVPSLDELTKYIDQNGCCIVNHFTVGRHTFGNITFLEPVNVAGLDLDEIITFDHKEVTVYPDDAKKPPVGQELNRKAQVTLDRVWPVDKVTNEPIKDVERLKQMKYGEKLRRISTKLGTHFVEYRPLTGSWVFEVDHFSKYGLPGLEDDDGEEENEQMNVDAKSTPGDKFEDTTSERTEIMDVTDFSHIWNQYDTAEERLDSVLNHVKALEKLQLEKSAQHTEHGRWLINASLPNEERTDEIPDPSIIKSQSVPSLQIEIGQSVEPMEVSQPSPKECQGQEAEVSSPTVAKVPSEEEKTEPKVTLPTFQNLIIPKNKSIVRKLVGEKRVDMPFMMGELFRIGWGPRLELSCLVSRNEAARSSSNAEKLCRLFTGRENSDYSTNFVQILQIASSLQRPLNKEKLTGHLEICLEASECSVVKGCAFFTPKRGNETLQSHSILSNSMCVSDEDIYEHQVWELMKALWGNLEYRKHRGSAPQHQMKMQRKLAVTEWLKDVTSQVAMNEVNEDDYISSAFSLLSAGRIDEASFLVASKNDFYLSYMISQAGSNLSTRHSVRSLLEHWNRENASTYVDYGRLKIMSLVSGSLSYHSKGRSVDIFQDLDWKRTFAVFLWYIIRASDPLDVAVASYEKCRLMKVLTIAQPDPPYVKNGDDMFGYVDEFQDMCFHLLKLYCAPTYPLKEVIHPATYTADVADYSFSWLVMTTLYSLGYTRLKENELRNIHVTFAAQLEANGMWPWAVFVLLHIKDTNSRVKTVTDVIERNVKLLEDGAIGFVEEEAFVCESLNVPEEWIYSSKATYAISCKRYKEACWYCIKSSRWNEAHDLLMEHIVPSTIINEEYEDTLKILEELMVKKHLIGGWIYKGGLIINYIKSVKRIDALVQTEDPNIVNHMKELMDPIIFVCKNVTKLRATSPKERLCKVEIAKRTMQFLRTILTLQECDSETYHWIIESIKGLPLPEDSVQQEMQEIMLTWTRAKNYT